MPRKRKINFPVRAKSSSTAAVTQHASRAVLTRCSGLSLGVMARNAGTVAIGSTMTKSELVASRTYSRRLSQAME